MHVTPIWFHIGSTRFKRMKIFESDHEQKPFASELCKVSVFLGGRA